MSPSNVIEIEVVDFKEDPANGAAFAVLFDVRGPGRKYELITVYFTEPFLEHYFHIPWHKKLPKEENRILREKRDLFLKWALLKVEQMLKAAPPRQDKITVDYDTDAGWAEKVENGKIQPASKQISPQEFQYETK